MYKIKLKDVLEKYKIIYCIVAHLDKGLIETLGNKEELAYQGLLKTHFYDIETIQSLDKFLEGQSKPKLFRQGEVACIICKPDNNVIIGLLYHEYREFPEYFKWSKEVNQEIEAIWK
ncbi:hypothetical protein [Clostridium sp. DJ247]|uniref:hypothetical protein n=1 Tax=Clostridium sp. DJ247 TaxID=2726188 RepID=UPI001625C64B|nr:hypothetical protein [Clostridium sp. DJ247]MBC2582761.1 hypothetical protein [Clostridium sp. DJ247]